jgi:hypothetical protein
MNKEELLNLLDSLGLPKTEYYILSSGSMMLYGLRESVGDLDLCVSNKLFKQLEKKYNLKEDDKNECGFYHITKDVEIVPNSKENFKMEYKDDYPVEDLRTILAFKEKRNAPKDQKDIENIKKYLRDSYSS